MNWKEIVQDYIIKHSDKIRKTTAPIRERLDVGYFTYHRIDSQGRYTVLVDRPDWAEHYVETKYFLDDPYLRHPDVYQSGLCSIEANGSAAYKERILREGKEVLNVGYNVLLIEKGIDSVEFFGFCANGGKSRLEQVALNRPGFLKAFATHFKNELSSVLRRMGEQAASLVDLKGKDFFRKDPIHPEPQLSPLLQELGLGTLPAMAGTLSLQEKKCLQGICLGRSAKETAAALNLSHRTVESYLETIKLKLSCDSKLELFSLAKEFEKFGLLP